MIRSFIAVEIPRFEKLLGLLSRLRSSGARLSVPKDESIHITLKFLGDIPESSIDKISESLGKIASRTDRFQAEIVGTGAFPNERAPRVLWVGLSDGGKLAEIAGEIDASMVEFGIPKEQRPFRPHITIARVKSMQGIDEALRVLGEYKSASFGSFEVKDMRLKKSTLTPAGAIYEDLAVKDLI
ncbi:MAG: RNA 2',3'-cyclic phosphodiesterase [Thermoplasmata archaeon]